MNIIPEIQAITGLHQLNQLLTACRATPVGDVLPSKGFYRLQGQEFCYPDGNIQYREYVDKRPATVVVPEDPDGNLIMVIQPTALVAEGSLIEFPAGYAESGENDLATGIREMLEETGLTTDSKHIIDLDYHYQDPGLVRQPVHVYLATHCEQLQAPRPDHGEYIQTYRVSKSMLLGMLFGGYLRDGNTQMAAVRALLQFGVLRY